MNIRSIELLQLNKKAALRQNQQAKMTNTLAFRGLNEEVVTEEPQEINPEVVTPSEQKMTFKGLRDTIATENTAIDGNEVVAADEEQTEAKEFVTPYASNMAFKGGKSKALSFALAGLLSLATVNTLTSCQDKIELKSEQIVNIDFSAILAQLQAMRDDMKADNAAQAAKFDKLIALIQEFMALQAQKNLDDATFQQKVLENMDLLIALGTNSNRTADETKDLIAQILNSNKSVEDKMDALLKLVTNIDANVADIKEIATQALAELKNIHATLNAMKEDNAEAFKELIKNGKISNYLLYKLDKDMNANAKINFAKMDQLTAAINNLDIDMKAEFGDIKAQLGEKADQIINTMLELGYTIEQINKMSTEQIVNAINENTAELKNQTSIQNKIALSLEHYLPILVKNGDITNAKLDQLYQAFIEASKNNDTEKLDEIIKQLENLNATTSAMHKDIINIGNDIKSLKNEVKKARIEIANQLKNGNAKLDVLINLEKTENKQNQTLIEQNKAMNEKLNVVIEILSNLDNKVYTIEELAIAMGDDVSNIRALLEKLNIKVDAQGISLDKLIAAVNATTAAVNENTAATQETNRLINIVIDLIKKLPQVGPNIDLSKVEQQLGTIIDMLAQNGQQNADATKLIVGWLEKIYNRMGDMAAKQDQMDKNQQKGFADVIAAIKAIKIEPSGDIDLSSVVNAINGAKTAIVDILGAGFNQNDANLKAILAKLDKLPTQGYDDAALMAKLDAILNAIINHTCNCNCGGGQGGNHEGILGDLDNILG